MLLFLRLVVFGLTNEVLGEVLHPFKFLFKSGAEIVRPILKQHDETEGEKDEEQKPEEPPDERHGRDANARSGPGQRCCTCLM